MIRKICVGIPNIGSVRTETVYSLIGALFRTVMDLSCGLHMVMPIGCLIDQNRQSCVKEALETGSSHLMFIDSDMVFPDDGILTLASRDKHIIGANYNLRDGTDRCTVKIADSNGNLLNVPSADIPKEPFSCYAVATGFMLIDVRIFNVIPQPWFFFRWDEKKQASIGEDVYFCEKAREYGFEVWCDPTIEMRHVGDYQF